MWGVGGGGGLFFSSSFSNLNPHLFEDFDIGYFAQVLALAVVWVVWPVEVLPKTTIINCIIHKLYNLWSHSVVLLSKNLSETSFGFFFLIHLYTNMSNCNIN